MTTAEDTKVSNRRNLYVREADREVWEKAERLAGDLSPLVSSLLRRWVEQREAARDRIVVEVEDRDGNVTRKAFRGRMLVSEFRCADPEGAGVVFSAAQGAQGGLAAWSAKKGQGERAGCFFTYDSFEKMADDDWPESWPEDFLSAVSSALGEDYAEEIDL
jgi:hypothetical protein